MNEKDKIWDELYEAKEDITEWLQLLEIYARNSPEPIWGKLNTQQIIKLTCQILEEIPAKLNQIPDQKKDVRELKKFKETALQELDAIERSLKNA